MNARKPLMAGNWKMYKTCDEAVDTARRIMELSDENAGVDILIAPPFTALAPVSEAIGNTRVMLGAQNLHFKEEGAYTGEISAAMLKSAGCSRVIVGHSERRHVFGETDEDTSRKVRSVVGAGLTPMLCVGEKLEEREAGETIAVVKRQLGALDGLDVDALGSIPIAYEPVWAIGTGKTATPADAAEVHAAIRGWFVDRGVDASAVQILYGGSVKVDNVQALVSEPDVDGVLVGGASLDPVQWATISRASMD